jgi:hypothetical protein
MSDDYAFLPWEPSMAIQPIAPMMPYGVKCELIDYKSKLDCPASIHTWHYWCWYAAVLGR